MVIASFFLFFDCLPVMPHPGIRKGVIRGQCIVVVRLYGVCDY